jgi:hypothetical protein
MSLTAPVVVHAFDRSIENHPGAKKQPQLIVEAVLHVVRLVDERPAIMTDCENLQQN